MESRDLQDLAKGYAYYCGLCDEVLFLSRKQILPRKVCLVFENCPGCGFELDGNLQCESSVLLAGNDAFTKPVRGMAGSPVQAIRKFNPIISRTITPHFQATRIALTTGMENLDNAGLFRPGQFTVLHGSASHDLSLFLCVRALLPEPLGPDSDVVFLDGGNIFDPYTIARYAIQHEIERSSVLRRVHISRAFTFHQLHSLATETLQSVIEKFEAGLVVVSDITLLFCDPDIRNKQDARDTFARTVRSLRETAERKDALVLATVLRPRNQLLDNILLRTAGASRELETPILFNRRTLNRITRSRAKRPLWFVRQSTKLTSFPTATGCSLQKAASGL